MFSTKCLGTAMLLGTAASSLANAEPLIIKLRNLLRDDARDHAITASPEITTVGVTTVTVYGSPAIPAPTIVTFTPDANTATRAAATPSVVTAWTIPAGITPPKLNTSTLPIISSTLTINVTLGVNTITLVGNTAIPSVNLTFITTSDAIATNTEHDVAASASSEGSSVPTATETKKNAAAADTVVLIGRSLKAMAAGLLLALAL